MAKAKSTKNKERDKKEDKEASKLFHSIMEASVNIKPKETKGKT